MARSTAPRPTPRLTSTTDLVSIDLQSRTPEQLRARRTLKWTAYPPDVLPMWVAEMDFPVCRAVTSALTRAVAAESVGYPSGVVRGELATHPQQVAMVAREALETLLLSARHVTVRVHPDDQPLVAQGAEEVLAARGARLLADAAVTRGGCVVESDIGIIDASIESRWRRAAAALGSEAPWTPEAAE